MAQAKRAHPQPRSADPVRAAWNRNAAWWDRTVGEGNLSQRELIGPATDRLLGPVRGQRVLDIACGNGHYSRRLASLGAKVVAIDFSERFLDLARARGVDPDVTVDYREVDATDVDQLRELAPPRFDAAVSTMALMDMAEIDPLFSALPQLLAPRARFVFSVTHPAFNHAGVTRVAEERDEEGRLTTRRSVRIEEYRTSRSSRGLGIDGQPSPHYYFDRSLTELFRPAFENGLVLDGWEEPVFRSNPDPSRPLSWANFPEIPPFLVARMRLG